VRGTDAARKISLVSSSDSPCADFDADVDLTAAARIHRQCRDAGITPRGLIHCMVVAVAWRHADEILSCDIDLYRVCGVVGVRLDPASLRAE